MATLPAANYLTDNARTEGEFKAGLEAMLSATKQIPGAGAADLAVTIAGDTITPAGGGGVLVIDTESSAATDDLANILQTNYPANACILLRNADASRVVTLKHAATGNGQLFLDRSADAVLDDTRTYLLLQRRGNDWYEVLRGPSRAAMPVVAQNGSFTVQKEDLGKVFYCTNAITVSLAAAASLGNGFRCSIINGNGAVNTVVLDPAGSETINGVTTFNLQPFGEVMDLVCDGSAFYTVGRNAKPFLSQVSYAATLTINSRDGDYFEVGTLTGNVSTFNLNYGFTGKRVTIRFVQDGTGGRTVALPADAKVAGSIASAASQASHLDLIFVFGGVARWEGAWTQIPA